jgi:hypothetical protein
VDSAENDSDNFFLYNNGISCLATKIDIAPEHINVRGLQVINGAQTVKSLVNLSGNAARAGRSLWATRAPKVLVRITEIPEGYGPSGRIRENIIKANNTQNSIKDSDFRSNDPVQENLKKQFAELTRNGKKVAYIPKRTDRPSGNTENVKMEEFAKSVYSFLFDPTDFSGASAFLFKDESADDGYQRVFGDSEKMPDDEFRYRAAVYWIAQEIGNNLKEYRDKLDDPDSRAALERKWLVVHAASIVMSSKLKQGQDAMGMVSRFAEGNWHFNGDDHKSKEFTQVFNTAAQGVIFAYKSAKRGKEDFVHRNWMRSKTTPAQIRDSIDLVLSVQAPA